MAFPAYPILGFFNFFLYIYPMKKDKIWYVYEIINVLGTIEYVGYTSRIRDRKWKHFKNKPKPGCFHGRFYQRQDCFFYIVKQFKTKIEAIEFETSLQKEWKLDTHGDAISKFYKKTSNLVKFP
jgi:predicted GIY-YIG superfamily endonuclease